MLAEDITIRDIANVLYGYPQFKRWRKKIKGAWIIGSFASNTQRSESDLDILILINAVRGYDETSYTEHMRNFVRRTLAKGGDHPRFSGKRLDLYFTYEVPSDERPRIPII